MLNSFLKNMRFDWRLGLFLCFCVAGVALRIFRITDQDFVFYDEGYYLNYLRPFGEIVQGQHFNPLERTKIVETFFRICLGSGKSLWFMLVDSRIFWGGLYDWSFSRILASFFGIMTLVVIWLFSLRYYKDKHVALLSLAMLAVLPSHVFYSRIGLQEAFSTFLVLSGFYFYLFPRTFGWRTFVAGILFGAAFFSNYRLIILPGIILVAEMAQSWSLREWPAVRKIIWTCLTFFSCVFLIGDLFNGANTWMVFSWIFHQGHMAEQEFAWINLLSYPYYVFRLESFWLGLLFFAGNVWLFRRGHRENILPFGLVLLQMGIFSLAAEKGARYLCVVLPFLVMSVARFLVVFWKSYPLPWARAATLTITAILLIGMANSSLNLALCRSDYRQVMQDIQKISPNAAVLSTQPYVQNLYVRDSKRVRSCPKDFELLAALSMQGFRYLVLDPQAYISYTPDEDRFLTTLDGYLGFLVRVAPTWRTYKNFEPLLLERFVFEHSDNLKRSVEFLKADGNFGQIRVYDLQQVIPGLMKIVSQITLREK